MHQQLSNIHSTQGRVCPRTPANVRICGSRPAFIRSFPFAAQATAVTERVDGHSSNFELLETRPILLQDLCTLVEDGKLRLDVQLQQNGMVWNSKKVASNLVVPVVQGKGTPPILLESDETGELRVLGGTPRLTALLAFVNGSTNVAGQHWPCAPVQLDARDSASIR